MDLDTQQTRDFARIERERAARARREAARKRAEREAFVERERREEEAQRRRERDAQRRRTVKKAGTAAPVVRETKPSVRIVAKNVSVTDQESDLLESKREQQRRAASSLRNIKLAQQGVSSRTDIADIEGRADREFQKKLTKSRRLNTRIAKDLTDADIREQQEEFKVAGQVVDRNRKTDLKKIAKVLRTKTGLLGRSNKKIAAKLERDEILTNSQAAEVFARFSKNPNVSLNLAAIRFKPPAKIKGVPAKDIIKAVQSITLVGFTSGRSTTATRPVVRVRVTNPRVTSTVQSRLRTVKTQAIRRRASESVSRQTSNVRSVRARRASIEASRQRAAQASLDRAQARYNEATKQLSVARTPAQSRNAFKVLTASSVAITAATVTVQPKALASVKPGQDVFVTVSPRRITTGKPAPAPVVKITTVKIPKTVTSPGVVPKLGTALKPVTPPKPEKDTKPVTPTVSKPTTGTKTPPAPKPGSPSPVKPAPVKAPAVFFTNPPRPKTPPPVAGSKAAILPPLVLSERSKAKVRETGEIHISRVNWKQGISFKSANLATGKIRSSRTPLPGGVRPGSTPRDSLKITGFTKSKPKKRAFDIGAHVAFISGSKIRFERDTGQPAIREGSGFTR